MSCHSPEKPEIKEIGTNSITHADVEHWLTVWNSHNIDSINALFSNDAVIYQPQNSIALTKNSMNAFFEMVFKTYPDITFESQAIIVEGYDVVSWENVTGTMLGTFTDPITGKVFQPNGKKFAYEAAKRIKYNTDHKIKELHILLDELILSRQLGLEMK